MYIVWIAISSGVAVTLIFALTRILRRRIDEPKRNDVTREFWDEINLN